MTTPGTESYVFDADVPPNPENLTDHILLPEQGETNPITGLSTFYGIIHETDKLPDHTAFDDGIPDHPTDFDRAITQYARPVTVTIPPVRQEPAQQTICQAFHFAQGDPSFRVAAGDGSRRRVIVSVVPENFTGTNVRGYLSTGSGLGAPNPGGLIVASIVPATMVREFFSADEVWYTPDATSTDAVWVSVQIERYQ